MDKLKQMKWEPKAGLYQCVIPNGKVHIDIFIDGRNPETRALDPRDEVELYERELRGLKRSEILIMGYLAPLFYFEKDSKGKEPRKVEATEDPDNPNVINDDLIYVKVQGFADAKEFTVHLNKINSILTVSRYKSACELLDKPQSYLLAANNRIEELNKTEMNQMYAGPIDAKRADFLTPYKKDK